MWHARLVKLVNINFGSSFIKAFEKNLIIKKPQANSCQDRNLLNLFTSFENSLEKVNIELMHIPNIYEYTTNIKQPAQINLIVTRWYLISFAYIFGYIYYFQHITSRLSRLLITRVSPPVYPLWPDFAKKEYKEIRTKKTLMNLSLTKFSLKNNVLETCLENIFDSLKQLKWCLIGFSDDVLGRKKIVKHENILEASRRRQIFVGKLSDKLKREWN